MSSKCTFFYMEDFIEKSTKLHLFTYYSQLPTTKKKKKQTLYKKPEVTLSYYN